MHALVSVRGYMKKAWQALFCLALLALVCRALVPAGYMPHHSEQSGLSMTFCTAQGEVVTLFVDGGAAPQDDHPAGLDCPYGVLASQALLPHLDTPLLAYTVMYARLHYLPPPLALPSLPASGPPLGSRAPPFNLA